MIAVNASTPLQYAPRQAEQAPTVNPPASFETDTTPAPAGQDTAEFSQTQAPASETPEGMTPPSAETPVATEASAGKKQAWYKKGFVAPAILGSVATGIGALVAGGKAFRSTLGAALAVSLALVGATVLARGNKKAEASTPPVEAPASTPVETPAEAKPVV